MVQPMSKGFDCYASMKNGVAEKFAADGYTFSAGYLFTFSKYKTLRDYAECKAVSDAGMYNVLLFENGAGTFDEQTASLHALHIPKLATATGAPRNGTVVIYVAVDKDAPADPNGPIAAYFKVVQYAVKAAGFLLGVYGSGAICKMLSDLGFVSHTMLSCSTGWAGYNEWLPHADIVQSTPETVHGIDIDPDVSNGHAGGFKV
jgi:hypothetical protein